MALETGADAGRWRLVALMLAAGLLIDSLILAFDIANPGRYATGVLYALPVLMGFWVRSSRATLTLAIVGTLFGAVGFALTPALPAADGTELLICRIAALLVLWGATVVTLRQQSARTLADQASSTERHQSALLQAILDTTPDTLIVIDQTGLILSFSRSAERLFGYPAEEVVGRNVSMLMPDHHRRAHDGYLERYLRTGERRIIGIGRVVEGLTRDGRTIPVELAVGEARVGEHRVFIGFIRDLSARQRIEEELRQAQKMEAIGQLTGGIAHDFNNLLTVITGNLELLAMDETLAENIALKEALEAAGLGAGLPGQRLSFGRRQPLDPKEVDVVALVHDVAGLLGRTLGDNIELKFEVRGNPGNAVVDASQLQNALLNLAINARDAMAENGKLVVAVFATELDPAYAEAFPEVRLGRYIAVQVADNGVGMSQAVRERAFDPFFTTKPQGAGSGLGLSMVYGFAKQSDGHVEIDSTPGSGTTVTLYLPRAEDRREGATEPDATAAPAEGHDETILVVEDNPRVRRVAVTRLTLLGYRVVEAQSGPEALDCLAAMPAIDLLFTDVVMSGGMSGFDLAREVRQRRPGLPVLFTSGYADPETIARERSEPDEEAMLRKPYSQDQLAHAVRRSLDRPA